MPAVSKDHSEILLSIAELCEATKNAVGLLFDVSGTTETDTVLLDAVEKAIARFAYAHIVHPENGSQTVALAEIGRRYWRGRARVAEAAQEATMKQILALQVDLDRLHATVRERGLPT